MLNTGIPVADDNNVGWPNTGQDRVDSSNNEHKTTKLMNL